MEWLQSLLDSSSTPVATAFLLGLLTAISPLPIGNEHRRDQLYQQGCGQQKPHSSQWTFLHIGSHYVVCRVRNCANSYHPPRSKCLWPSGCACPVEHLSAWAIVDGHRPIYVIGRTHTHPPIWLPRNSQRLSQRMVGCISLGRTFRHGILSYECRILFRHANTYVCLLSGRMAASGGFRLGYCLASSSRGMGISV